MTTMNQHDADRLELLDRIKERVPELDLDRESVEWTTLDDGHEALLVNGGGIDGGSGTFFANHGEDVHAVGSLDPLVPGHVGCIVIKRRTAAATWLGPCPTRWRSRSRRRILRGRCRRRTSRSCGRQSKLGTGGTARCCGTCGTPMRRSTGRDPKGR
jgi:hypothetical protein